MNKNRLIWTCSVLAVFAFCTTCATLTTSYTRGEIKGPLPKKFPPPEKCAKCHNIPIVYEELSRGPHNKLKCLDCHIPGKVQRARYESKDCSFSRLGYHERGGNWIECADGNQSCLRCHKAISNTAEKCWSCHMPEGGMDELVILKDKKAPRTPENIRETKKIAHRNHTFKRHGR
ncbi:MAG: hypothetical protein HWN69_01705 [Desulfobacterales bacterium]|nr:hypothetical protein [Desulfobacterales bacterium]